ncbi:LysR family transcriptional regulator [Pseudovibrio exalbescens]|uniref:LysR family transcriptional regulator n=1 Tax=Pseudovibrio exalbescens TaxID=197461 RepID=UPI0023654032|nr:LysR family transcriptional regulator [Pseudovibrio exalbescens]MDD7911358.1 LysR family transcriptional regulator [Pseudovibrio exalbescens]
MKSTRLLCFIKAAELGSFSATATTLNMQVSSVTRHVTALEEELGARFFNRSRKRITLTEAGGLFLPFAKRILEEERRAREAVNGLQTAPTGELTISCTRAFGEYWLAARLPKFMEAFPHVQLALQFDDRVIDLSSEGVDLAIRIGVLTDSGLIALRILENEFLLVASPDYLERHGTPQTLADLAKLHGVWLAYPRWSNFRVLGQKDMDLVLPQRIELNTPASIHQVVRNAGGISALPTWMVSEDVASGRLVPLLTSYRFSPYESDNSAVYAVYQERRFMPPKIRAFLDFLKGEAAHTKPS